MVRACVPLTEQSADANDQIHHVIRTILGAQQIVVVCGAGISVEAGIPDFRSSTGLFQTLKRDNPGHGLTTGKELFDASVFRSADKTSLFSQMIAQMSILSQAATPTPFHQLLGLLEDRGNLLRVYTQNIDAIEAKCGLSYGVPSSSHPPNQLLSADPHAIHAAKSLSSTDNLPRCIPLHGTLRTMHCETCTRYYALDDHISSLLSGILPNCPGCTIVENERLKQQKRPHHIGKIRPSVVLYNEQHRDGDQVGEIIDKDLKGGGGRKRCYADLVLVVGTSLKVHGTKQLVRGFSDSVRSQPPLATSSMVGNPTPTKMVPIKSLYLNLESPVPAREWEGVFDVWVQGDVQRFAEMVMREIENGTRCMDVRVKRKWRIAQSTEAKKRKLTRAASPIKMGGPVEPHAKQKTKTVLSSQTSSGSSHANITQTKHLPPTLSEATLNSQNHPDHYHPTIPTSSKIRPNVENMHHRSFQLFNPERIFPDDQKRRGRMTINLDPMQRQSHIKHASVVMNTLVRPGITHRTGSNGSIHPANRSAAILRDISQNTENLAAEICYASSPVYMPQELPPGARIFSFPPLVACERAGYHDTNIEDEYEDRADMEQLVFDMTEQSLQPYYLPTIYEPPSHRL